MAVQQIWQQHPLDASVVDHISGEFGVHRAIAAILAHRGIIEDQHIHDFMNPSLGQLPSPGLMKGMDQAVQLLAEAVSTRTPIAVFGDYDVDGITGTAILTLFFENLGVKVVTRQPNRLTEGYGLNANALKQMADGCGLTVRKNALLVTIDCGISDHNAVLEARGLGFKVIITDHHHPPASLPDADVILNPLQPGCQFPFKQLAGAGVAFYLISGLRSLLRNMGYWAEGCEPNLKQYLDLVAIGTICDMVPLKGVNRILVKSGMEVLADTKRPGLVALKEIARLDTANPCAAEDIGFRVGPRLNALGRVAGDPAMALELLCTQNINRARQLAQKLDTANSERRNLSDLLYADASGQAQAIMNKGYNSIVLWGDNWPVGVLGIVASRITNEFYRPTVLFSASDGIAKGSGRSVHDLNLYELLSECRTIERFGGHRMAAGLTVEAGNLERFSQEFEQLVARRVTGDELQPRLWIDWQMQAEDLSNESFIKFYSKLEPFGIENPEPVFMTNNCRVSNPMIVGENHLKFNWAAGKSKIDGIGFGFGAYATLLKNNAVDLAYAIRPNFFRGEKTWQLHVVALNTNSSAGLS